MLDIDSKARFDAPSTPAATGERRASRRAAHPENARILVEIQPFPVWARRPTTHVDGPNAAADAAFRAGAGLALVDRLLRAGEDGAEPAYAGAFRRRLALRAAANCARLARLREDEAALRDAERLAPPNAPASPAGRLHRLFRLFGERPLRVDGATLAAAAELLALRLDEPACFGLVEVLQDSASRATSPLTAASEASRAAMTVLSEASSIDAEILALWLADLALAQKLGWPAPVPLLATAFHHPALRIGPKGRRPRPNDPDWPDALARATALACEKAFALAADLSRRAEKLLQAAPKLRAKRADRVVALLLSDDCVTPALAAKHSGLSDRAARRLFDRLIELGAVRELSGRANFRLYGL